MKPPFRLITMHRVSHDTVRCLRALLKKAEEGEVIGVAYTAMHKENRTYAVHACGEAHRNPTFAIGMARLLVRKLEDQVIEEGA